MNIYSDREEFISELKNVIRMFIPFLNMELDIWVGVVEGRIECIVEDRVFKLHRKCNDDKTLLREYKIALYRALSKYFNKKLPWGSLTGIRPTRIVYKMMEEGASLNTAANVLRKKYLVSRKKVSLVKRIIQGQQMCLYNCDDFVNIYVHIPFCPSKCGYCSFVSLDAKKSQDLIDPYLQRLLQELQLFNGFYNKKILSVYVGGGTPTVLNPNQLYRLLEGISLLNPDNVEFTLEAGRPDTITAEKLAILKRFKVNRICINPQTFCQKTLAAIGRSHTLNDVYTAFELGRKFDFDINMDLIAGLENETAEDFAQSVAKAIELRPENITIHTLSIKNGSNFFNSNRKFNHSAAMMVESAKKMLTKADYLPYYLYRQKNMSDNLENIGFTQGGRQSIFNITSMEETVSVLGFGAGAITKIVTQSSIERFASLRDVELYIKNFEQMHQKKQKFLLGFDL